MALIHIYADTRGRSACKSCQAPIEWAENVATGKKIPFDGEIVPVRSYNDDDHRLIEVVDTAVTTSHFATCPDAKDWRRR